MEVNNILVPYKFKGRRRGDLCSVVADNSLALEKLKWQPKRDISDMCLDAWKWINSEN